MKYEIGYVLRTEGDRAVVQLMDEQCDTCGSGASCCTRDLHQRKITIANSIGAAAGDTVRIRYHAKSRMLSGLLIFIFPVILGFLGYFLAFSYAGTESAGIAGTFAGFVLAFIVIWAANSLFERKKLIPTMLKVDT